ncbi:MAG: spore protease YyaC [Sedimentibacter sp.]|uniref:spore protease YyaC n=1 Tax=Sedimentibacter sp. TaxID=1960295 RepID=UPI0031598A01
MNPIEVHYKNSFAAIKIGSYLAEHMKSNFALVCIGTDKCIVDSLGPLTGTLLSKENFEGDIYGTLDKPVHAMNINEYIKILKKKNYEKIIAIDACLSNKKNQGVIEVREGSITPGKGIGKMLPEIGDVSVIGIVDSSDKEFHDLVQDTRLSLIYDMAQTICKGVILALEMNNRLQSDVNEQASLSSL